MIAEVIVDIAHSQVDKIFDYIIPDDSIEKIRRGVRVMVPFGNREIEGYVIRLKENSDYDSKKLKSVCYALEDYEVLPEESLELMFFMTKHCHIKLIDAIRLFIPAEMRGNRVKELTKNYVAINPAFLQENGFADVDFEDAENFDKLELFIKKSARAQKEVFLYLFVNGDQPLAKMNEEFSASALRNLIVRKIVHTYSQKTTRRPYKNVVAEQAKHFELTAAQQAVINQVQQGGSQIYLLHGVTGSGKTEIYLNCIERAIEQNKSAIMLVPEISLTPQVLKAFRSRFQDNVALLHSGLSAGERFDEWHRLLTGEAKIAVGARSAIFAPLRNLGVIIVDEEHDGSYISENTPRYDCRDIAEFRQKYNQAKLILGSATPSIESYYNAKQGKYKLFELKERVNNKPLPKIKISDMVAEVKKGNNSIFSTEMSALIKDSLDSGGQIMLFINRRGYASYMLCRNCGYIAKCDDCDVSLVYHREESLLKCHYCNNRYKALDICPDCGSPHIRQGLVGTQRVEAEIKALYKNAKILRMDKDTTQAKDAHSSILAEFASGRANVLIGTQMIAKGHDFPNVTMVGIIDADLSLYCNGYMGTERTFQLITQVAGRAGRDNKEGVVVLQSYQPRHYVYKFAAGYNYKGFFEKESNLRETTKYPPFSKMIRILLRGENEQEVVESLKCLYTELSAFVQDNRNKFYYFAKMKAPVKKIQNKFRYQVLMRLKIDQTEAEQKIFEICDKYNTKNIDVFVEINPLSLS